MNPLKALIFLAAGLVAALGVAWFAGALDPLTSEAPPVAAGSSEETGPKGGRPAASPSGEGQQAAAPTASSDVIPPSFDILRVEPDGSIVIAGKAAPEAKVEILSGSQVIGSADAGGEGDFVAVLEDRLKPGDYQIVLRSTAPNNVVAASPETAIVSIPDHRAGQVLALVEQPGEPSRLITVPKPEPAAPTVEAPQAPAAAQSGTEASREATPSAAENRGGGGEQQELAAAAEEEGSPASKPQSAAPAPAPGDAAATTGEAETPGSAAPGTGQPTIAVEAVEIEGRNVFVAGTADPASLVRVYANDILLGETQAAENGRFLIETERDLAVGDYIIRADVLAADGSVVARAAVPFTREEGESIAAVAPPAASQVQASEEPKPGGEEPAASHGEKPAARKTDGGAEPPSEGSHAVAPTAPKSVEGPRANAADGTDPAAGPPTVTAPKLQAVDTAVIIRRGDNLWRISRRVYGRGIRYSTIYLANQDQISDPDRIWPGQVFAVPGKTPQGETADMEAIGDRATTLPPKAR